MPSVQGELSRLKALSRLCATGKIVLIFKAGFFGLLSYFFRIKEIKYIFVKLAIFGLGFLFGLWGHSTSTWTKF